MRLTITGSTVSIHEFEWDRGANGKRNSGQFGRILFGPIKNTFDHFVYPNESEEIIFVHCVVYNEKGEPLFWNDPIRIDPEDQALFSLPIKGYICA
jgi:hypothetical protein